MAEDPWKRLREREEQREREAAAEAEEALRSKQTPGTGTRALGRDAAEGPKLERFDEFVRRIPNLLEQLEHLYRQYATGVLERPPVEERLRLDQMLTTLANWPKATPADRFRFNTVNGSYITYKNRWDKLLLDIEKGIIKRITGKHRHRG